LPKNKAAKRQQVQFPERIRITGPGVASNFILTEWNRQFTYVIYYDNVSGVELFLEGTYYEMYTISQGMVSSGQTSSFSLPSSLANGYTVSRTHTTPTLSVSISQLVQSKVYDGEQASPSFTSAPANIEVGEYYLSGGANTPGTYTISLVEGSKTSRFIWGGPYPSVSYTITKRPVTLTMEDRTATYRSSGAQYGDVLTAPMAYNSPSGVGLVSGSAQYIFAGLLQNLPPSVPNAGTYTVSINPNYPGHPLYTISGYTNNKTTATITITKATPTIYFNPNSSGVSGGSVTLTASTNPTGVTVNFAVVSGPANITNGNILNFTGAGSVVVSATSVANTNYNSASQNFTFTVSLPASDGIPNRLTTFSDFSPSWGRIETAKEYTSFRPLTGNQVELGGIWAWYNYVRTTTTLQGGTFGGGDFTSYLSKDVETNHGNRNMVFVVLNPRHALVHHYYGSMGTKHPTWAVYRYEVAYDADNGDSYGAELVATNPSSDALNLPTSGWTENIKFFPQMARDISVTYKNYYPFPLAQQYSGYLNSFVTTTLQKYNTLPKSEGSGYSNNLVTTFSTPSLAAKGLLQNFYAKISYPDNYEYGDPDNDFVALTFGCYNYEPYVHSGYADYNGTTDTHSNFTYNYRPLINTWALASFGTYYHGDGSGTSEGGKYFYNVPTNTNRNVLPPSSSTISSPTWRVAGGYPNGISYPTFKSYVPNYSESPIPDILLATGSIYSYLNREWTRQNIGDPLAFDNSEMIYLSSGLAYRCGVTGYHLLSPGTVLKRSDVVNDNYPYSGGITGYTSSSSQWKIVYVFYNSDYVTYDIEDAWFTSVIGGDTSKFPFDVNFTHPPGWTSSTISFAPQLFY